MKEKVQTLIDKTSNDDKLIDMLKTELRKKPTAAAAPAAAAPARASGASAAVPGVVDALERKAAEQQRQLLMQERIIVALQEKATAAAAAPAGAHVLEVQREQLEQLVEVFRQRVEHAEAVTADARAWPAVVHEERGREDLVGSHGRWKHPCLQPAHMTI